MRQRYAAVDTILSYGQVHMTRTVLDLVRRTLAADGKIRAGVATFLVLSQRITLAHRTTALVTTSALRSVPNLHARKKWVQINSLLHQRRAIGAEVTGASGILESGSEPEAFILGQELVCRQVM